MPKISVITAVYNAEPFLEKSIVSILEQSFRDFEFILVNDASTDGSAKILERHSTDPRITIIHNDANIGCAASRNKAVCVANGEYFAIHDADDISYPYRLSTQNDALSDADIVGSHAVKMNEHGNEISVMKYPPKDIRGCIYAIVKWKLNPIIDPSSAFHRSVLEENNLYSTDPELSIAADFDLWCNAIIRQKKITNIQGPLIKYRVHQKNNTNSRKGDMALAADKIWSNFLKHTSLYQEQIKGFALV